MQAGQGQLDMLDSYRKKHFKMSCNGRVSFKTWYKYHIHLDLMYTVILYLFVCSFYSYMPCHLVL